MFHGLLTVPPEGTTRNLSPSSVVDSVKKIDAYAI